MYEADKPDIVSDFSDVDMLVTEQGTQVDLAVTHTDPATLGYLNGPIVKRVLRDFRVVVFTCRRCIHFARIFPAKCLMRPVVIVTLDKYIEPALLLQKVVTG